jgi:hypothetical protein
MDEQWVAVIGVVGTLGGVISSYWLQRKSVVSERLRQERIAAYGDFAGTLMDYRRTQLDRRRARREGESEDVPRQEVYRTRSAAWGAYYRVRLVTGDEAVLRQARVALDLASSIMRVSSDEVEAAADGCRDAVAAFTDIARPDIARV